MEFFDVAHSDECILRVDTPPKKREVPGEVFVTPTVGKNLYRSPNYVEIQNVSLRVAIPVRHRHSP